MSAGLFTTWTPAFESAAIFSAAVPFAAGNDRAGVPHPASGRRGLAGDEADDRLLEVLRDERGGFFLGGAADLADHHDGFGLRIVPANSVRASMKLVPISGSPPMPMQVV